MTRRKESQYRCCVRTFRAAAVVAICLLLVSPQTTTTGGGIIAILGCQAFASRSERISSKTKTTPVRVPARTMPQTPTLVLHMNFVSDFLGSFQGKMNTGGSYNLGIDYDTLAFPGPEVGAMAVAITAARMSSSKSGEAMPHSPSAVPSAPHLELATFAGGCFWGLELALQRCEGIEHTLAGYTQGGDSEVRPNYEQVSAGNTGHCEAVLVCFDPTKASYESILRTVLDRVDVTTVDGQGKDFGRQYRTGLYFHTPSQEETAKRILAEEVATNPRYGSAGASASASSTTKKAVATEVEPAKAFWPAEEYHQKYLEKGGRFGTPQSAEKGNTDEIRCYG